MSEKKSKGDWVLVPYLGKNEFKEVFQNNNPQNLQQYIHYRIQMLQLPETHPQKPLNEVRIHELQLLLNWIVGKQE